MVVEHKNISPEKKVSLWYLVKTFLLIGLTSFGGYLAMVAVVQDILVHKKKLLDNKIILDGISLASLLPGPVSINVVTYLGNYLKGFKGGIFCMLAAIFPSFLIVLLLSYLYFTYGNLVQLDDVFYGVYPAVVAIVVATGIKMFNEAVFDSTTIFIVVGAFVCFLLFKGILYILLVFVLAGIVGIIRYKTVEKKKTIRYSKKSLIDRIYIPKIRAKHYIAFIIILLIIYFVYFIPVQTLYLLSLRKVFITFSTMSVSLIGGAYVFIPTIQDIVVNQLHWLTEKEYLDGIALGQITPGPIMITSTFIGYKVAGIGGSIVSTLGIFLPPGLLMIGVSKIYSKIANSNSIKAIFKGIRASIIGLIFYAAILIAKPISIEWFNAILFGIVLFISLKYKWNVISLVIVAGVIGFIYKHFIFNLI